VSQEIIVSTPMEVLGQVANQSARFALSREISAKEIFRNTRRQVTDVALLRNIFLLLDISLEV